MKERLSLLLATSKALSDQLVRLLGSQFHLRLVDNPESIETVLRDRQFHCALVEWNPPWQETLVDLLELLPETAVLVYNDSNADASKALRMGAVSELGSRHLDSTLMAETICISRALFVAKSDHAKVKSELVHFQMDERERQERVERQRQALFSFARSKLRESALGPVLQRLAKVCQEMVGADRVSIWINQDSPDVFYYKTFAGESFNLDPEARLDLSQQKVYLQELERGQPLAMSSLQNLSLYQPQLPFFIHREHTALVDAPVFFNGKVRGLLRIEDGQVPREWQLEELGFVDSICDMISLALENDERVNILREMKTKEGLYLAKLEKSNAELQEFASIVSHDLQEPLYKVKAFGEVLVQRYSQHLDSEGIFIIERIQNASVRMSNLIVDLLSYSRVTSKARSFESVDLNQIIDDVLGDLEFSIVESQAEIKIAPLPIIEADSMQMRQLFQNLISNGIKFKKEKEIPQISIWAEAQDDDKVVIHVEDQGIGFDPSHSEKIFGVFQRIHPQHNIRGTGIGLAIVRKIVQRHQGQILAESAVLKGSRFIIELPKIQVKVS